LVEEDNQAITDKYAELDTPFAAMQSIGAGILKGASFNVTILNNAALYASLVELAETSDPFLKQVLILSLTTR
jgi:hypothetical protein